MPARRSAILVLALLLLTVSVQAAPPGSATVPSPREDHEAYIPIVPPDTIPGFLAETQTITAFLTNLPVDSQLAHDVLEKVLDALAVNLGDVITQILKAFGINWQVDLGQFSFRWILNLLHFYSYNQDQATKILETWAQGMTPAQEESLKRFYLAQIATQVGFQASLMMANDAAEGLYDLIDLILAATRMVDKIGSGLEHIPGAGQLIARIKVMIIQRIVFGFQAAVDLATSPMSEPNRSRVRAVANALATTYIKWKDIQLQDGFGGISVETVTKVGFAVMGKTLVLMGPKVGIVHITTPAVNLAAMKAAEGQLSGTFDQARLAVLDDGVDATELGYTERVVKTSLAKSKLSRYERQIANVAGAISQIAQLYGFLDPSSFVKGVAIVAGILAGGLQIHSIFNSVHYLYKIPNELKGAIDTAFHPDQAGSNQETDRLYKLLAPEAKAAVASQLREAHTRFVGSVEEAAQASIQPDVELLVGTLERLDKTSQELTEKMSRLGSFQRRVITDAGSVDDPVYSTVLDHHLKLAAVQAAAVGVVIGKDRRAARGLRTCLEALEQSTRQAVEGLQGILDLGMVEAGTPSFELSCPGALRGRDMMTVKATLRNCGTAPAQGIVIKLLLPPGYKCNSSAEINLGTLLVGKERSLSWTVVGQAASLKRACFTIVAQCADDIWASRFIQITK
ncbi:MAG: hypothetical protein HY815_20690 [Candidatus Riflebacteria bacterium]|nr:hypothetical protein [Candidatus Riflebacteria bacterium]